MSDYVIEIKNLSKQYQLGIISSGTLARDLSKFGHVIFQKVIRICQYLKMIQLL